MPTTYRTADHLQPLLAEVIEAYHPDLKRYGVTFTILTAHSDPDSDKPALSVRGHAAAGQIKINNLKDRVAGLADATLLLDGDRWESWTPAQQRSLLDHECTHLVVVVKDGVVQTDDCGRPRLKIRHHDEEIGIFRDVIERHGEECLDVEACKPLHKFLTQQVFPYG